MFQESDLENLIVNVISTKGFEYVFGEKGFSDVELQVPGKITLDEFNKKCNKLNKMRKN